MLLNKHGRSPFRVCLSAFNIAYIRQMKFVNVTCSVSFDLKRGREKSSVNPSCEGMQNFSVRRLLHSHINRDPYFSFKMIYRGKEGECSVLHMDMSQSFSLFERNRTARTYFLLDLCSGDLSPIYKTNDPPFPASFLLSFAHGKKVVIVGRPVSSTCSRNK